MGCCMRSGAEKLGCCVWSASGFDMGQASGNSVASTCTAQYNTVLYCMVFYRTVIEQVLYLMKLYCIVLVLLAVAGSLVS